jgi:hypothetical protein
MSIPCMNRVWELSNQKGAALFLLVALADYADPNGLAWPGIETLARKTRLSSRHVSRLVTGLQAAGELLVLPRPGRSHLYVILTGTDARLLAAALQRAAGRGAEVHGYLEATLDRSAKASAAAQAVAEAARTPDKLSGVGGDNLSSPPDTESPVLGQMSGAHDIAVSSDPSLSAIDPAVNKSWQQALKMLGGAMTRRSFDHLLLGSRVVGVQGDLWTVQVHYPLALDWLQHRLSGRIRHLLAYIIPFLAPPIL